MLFLQNFSKKSKWSQIIFCRNVLSDEGWVVIFKPFILFHAQKYINNYTLL